MHQVRRCLTVSIERAFKMLRILNAAYVKRVCRAWHVTMSVKVRQPGFRRAEG